VDDESLRSAGAFLAAAFFAVFFVPVRSREDESPDDELLDVAT